jgi:methylenetetrahydrofolate dehydrogenase (NADP+)/methenyltetrahydrofolate cyclohydrolase
MQEQKSSIIISGKKIAQEIKDQVKIEVESLTQKLQRKPTVISLIIGDNKESKLYLKLRNKACFDVGIEAIQHEFPIAVTEREVISKIQKINDDEEIDGIFVQLPLPSHLNTQKILSCINASKDVEGFTAENMGRLVNGYPHLIPCTPNAVMKILAYHHIELEGRHVVIVNHSTVVGKPLALLCLQQNATVSVVHIYTKNMKEITRNADVLITAAGVPHLITEDYVKDGAIVIDVAIVNTENGVTGDVDFERVKHKTNLITPVPGGVGPVTIASALENMVIATKASINGENEV